MPPHSVLYSARTASAAVSDLIVFIPHFSLMCERAASALTLTSRSQGRVCLTFFGVAWPGSRGRSFMDGLAPGKWVLPPWEAVPPGAQLPWRMHVSPHLCGSIWEDVTFLVFNS